MRHGTARLDLAPVAESDCVDLLRVFRDVDVRRHLLDGETVSPPWVAEEIQASNQRFDASAGGLWAVRRRDEASVIGFVGFREFFVLPEPQLLYGLFSDHPRGFRVGIADPAGHARAVPGAAPARYS